MFLKITPKKFENKKTDHRNALCGILDTPHLYLNTSDISLIRFGDGAAQIRLTSGGLLDTETPEEVAQLQAIAEAATGIPDFIRGRGACVASCLAEDNAMESLRL